MGIFRKYVNQTRKPEGILGKIMIAGMNSGHASMASWGTHYLKVKDPKNVIDLGCGGGRNVKELAKRYKRAKVTGLDYSELSVQKSKKLNAGLIKEGRCQIVQGDVSHMDLPEEKYDLATAFETIYFWPGLEKCFAEVAKILKTGGTFLIVNESDGEDEASKKFEKIIDGMKTYTPEMIEKALKSAGFSKVQSYRYEKKPWVAVVAVK